MEAKGWMEDMARMASGAAGAALEMRREMEQFCRQQMEKIGAQMQLVSREEFEVVRAMAQAAREENARLAERIAALEAANHTHD